MKKIVDIQFLYMGPCAYPRHTVQTSLVCYPIILREGGGEGGERGGAVSTLLTKESFFEVL
jgi:hypothetical protein